MVVCVSPVFDEDLGFEEAVEGLEVQQLVAEFAVEGFDVGVLSGCTGFDVGRGDPREAAPVS